MHPADIVASIRKAGSTQTAIAHRLGVSCSTVSSVIAGRFRSRRVALAIARITNVSIDELWPGAYESQSAQVRAVTARAA